MHYKKTIIFILLAISSTQSTTAHKNNYQQESIDQDLEAVISEFSDNYVSKEEQSLPIQQTNGLTEKIKIQCRVIGIILLSYAADAKQWFSKTRSKVGLWLHNI